MQTELISINMTEQMTRQTSKIMCCLAEKKQKTKNIVLHSAWLDVNIHLRTHWIKITALACVSMQHKNKYTQYYNTLALIHSR